MYQYNHAGTNLIDLFNKYRMKDARVRRRADDSLTTLDPVVLRSFPTPNAALGGWLLLRHRATAVFVHTSTYSAQYARFHHGSDGIIFTENDLRIRSG